MFIAKIFFFLSLLLPINAVDISHCKSKWPVPFNKDLDHISLHYDFAPDGDDLMSTGADRSFLETVYGTQFLADHTSRVGGTYGNNPGSYYPSSIPVMEKVWGDVGGAYRAKGGSTSSDVVAGELKLYQDAISRGGLVYVKEGGQSDFTVLVVKELEKWAPNSGKCVYVTQHSSVNEEKSGSGVLSYVKSKTVYQKISDGNPALRKTKWRLNGNDFAFYTKQSKQACAWDVIFAEFKKQKTYCKGVSGKVDQSVCVDFSDSHELFWNVGFDIPSHTIDINEFVQKYLLPVPDSEKMTCTGVVTTTTATTAVTTTTLIPTTKPTGSSFSFIFQSGKGVESPIIVKINEKFNVKYNTSIIRAYTFLLSLEGKIILTHVEKINPYYLYGDTSGVVKYGTINKAGNYILKIKETNDSVSFSVVQNIFRV